MVEKKTIKIRVTEQESEDLKASLRNISHSSSQRSYAILTEIFKRGDFIFS